MRDERIDPQAVAPDLDFSMGATERTAVELCERDLPGSADRAGEDTALRFVGGEGGGDDDVHEGSEVRKGDRLQ
jgi:hypothetical protein